MIEKKSLHMVSVIIPLFNAALYIGSTIKSLLKQTYRDFELILVDDGSTDKTVGLIEKYAKMDSRIVIIKKENSGVSDARNLGVLHAKGEYIIFFDGDDIIAPCTLEHMVQSIEEATLVYVGSENVTSRMIGRWKWNILSLQQHQKVFSGHDMFCLLYDNKGYNRIKGFFWGMLIPKVYFDKMKVEIYTDKERLPVTFFEDVHLTYRFFWNAEKVAFLNQTYVLHRLVDNSLSRSLRPSVYAYELMEAGKVHLEYLINKREKACFRLALPEYLKTIMKLWWQVERYEEDTVKRERTMELIIKSFEHYYHYYKNKCNRNGIIQKISIHLFHSSPQVWKMCVGDVWFLLKYKLDQIKR